jgi:hypothetical protein
MKDFLGLSLAGALAPDVKEMDDFCDKLPAMRKIKPTPTYAIQEATSSDYAFQKALGPRPLYQSMSDVRVA